MRFATLVGRGLRHHGRDHLGVLLGVAVGAAVLTGALVVGDSARHTLRGGALLRVGRATLALQAAGAPFADGLAGRLEERLGVPVAPVLHAPGMALAAHGDGRRQVNRVQVYGVDGRFARFAPGEAEREKAPAPRPGEAALGRELAAALGVRAGDRISLRLAVAARLPREAPLAGGSGRTTALASATVAAVVPDEALGRFGLASSMRPPRNAFVDLGWLQGVLGRDGLVSLLVVAGGEAGPTADEAGAALREVFDPGMAGLSVRSVGRVDLLESERVFLEPAVSAAALATPGTVGAFTYLVNSISRESAGGVRATPYSFVAALSRSPGPALGPVPPGMREDEILLNRWTADRIGARRGDRVALSYPVVLPGGGFEERRRSFSVRRVLPMERVAAERAYVPQFPGLTDVESCRDWDIGLPLDEEMLRDEPNEAYWREFGPTPKAFVTLAAGQEMWGNRWGDVTAVRFPAGALAAGTASLAGRVTPEALGLAFRPVREEALRSAAEATDLGGLFLGMSLFLVVAALVLTGVLFAFGVERRAGETGTLLAVGFTRARIAATYFAEGAIVGLAGAAAGAIAGQWYARALLAGLRTSWSGAVAGLEIVPHVAPWSALAGGGAAFLAAVAAVALTLRRQMRLPARVLLAACDADGTAVPRPGRTGRWLTGAAVAAAAAALVVVSGASSAQGDPAAAFFAAGTLLLVAALLGARRGIGLLECPGDAPLTAAGLVARGLSRRPGRSMAVITLLAGGGFIVFAVAAMRTEPGASAGRDSGGGGFALVGESDLPLRPGQLADAARRALPDGEAARAVVPLKVSDGDDATCLNLNHAATPRLVGVDPGELERRGAFAPAGEARAVWGLLELTLPDGEVPGLVGDEDTARWNLRVRTGPARGDVIVYRDGRGGELRVRLVGALPVRKSVFQGTVIVPLAEFVRRFPGEEGFRMFLADAPPGRAGELRAALEEELGRQGLEVRTPAERLAAYYAVEHAYQEMFLALGGLGLLLGTAGLGAVVLRNLLERRAELALLAAVGIPRGRIALLLFAEHFVLFSAGLAAGIVPALVAVLPALRSPGAQVPVSGLAAVALALVAAGAAVTLIAAAAGVRGPLVPALRRE